MLVHLAAFPVGLPFNADAEAHCGFVFALVLGMAHALLGAAIAHGRPMGALLTFGWFLLHINLHPLRLW